MKDHRKHLYKIKIRAENIFIELKGIFLTCCNYPLKEHKNPRKSRYKYTLLKN